MKSNLFSVVVLIALTAGCVEPPRQQASFVFPRQANSPGAPGAVRSGIAMPPKPASELAELPLSSPSIKTGSKAGSFALVTIPPYATELKGSNEVRFRNPNTFPVLIMIRCEEKGKNIEIPAKSMTSVFLPDGGYQISFVFASVPNEVHRSDHIHLPAQDRPDVGIPYYLGH